MRYTVFAVGVESDEILIEKSFTSELKAWKFLVQKAMDYHQDGGTLKGHVGINQIAHQATDGTRTTFYISKK